MADHEEVRTGTGKAASGVEATQLGQLVAVGGCRAQEDREGSALGVLARPGR